RRVDLAGPLLALASFGERDLRAFPWFEAPPPAAVERGLERLARLGALDARGITERGRTLARLPAHPRIAALLVEAHARGALSLASLAAELLQERDPFTRGARTAGGAIGSDVLERALDLRDFAERGRSPTALDPGAARFAVRVAETLPEDAERVLGPERAL